MRRTMTVLASQVALLGWLGLVAPRVLTQAPVWLLLVALIGMMTSSTSAGPRYTAHPRATRRG